MENKDHVDVTGSKGKRADMDDGKPAEGAKYKGNPDKKADSHQEGQYDKQDDDAGTWPSANEDNT